MRVSRFATRQPVLRAVILFCFLMGLFYGFVHTANLEGHPYLPYLRLIAATTAGMVSVLGYETDAVDTLIVFPGFSMKIVHECDGIELVAVFVSGVLASPVSL